jgi:hypothetical protein
MISGMHVAGLALFLYAATIISAQPQKATMVAPPAIDVTIPDVARLRSTPPPYASCAPAA